MDQIGTGHTKRERVYALLDSLGIAYGKVDHPAIFTQADSELRPVQTDAVIFKNLFLRNKDKSRYYLYSLPLTQRADLPAVAKALSETRLSFGDADALARKLNIQHGAVSFLNIIGAECTDVTLLIDSTAFDCDKIGVHPNENTATVILRPQDIERILHACDARYKFIAFINDEPILLRAQEDDAAEILRLQYAAYQSEAILYNNLSIQPLTQTSEQVTAEFQNNIFIKAVWDGRIIGSVRAYENGGTAYIGKLMVLPGYQDRGVGKRLLQAIEREYRGKRFELYTGAKSTKNLSLYETFGYSRFKTEEAAPGLTMVYLEKLTGDEN
jgi:GNAT superfamily N-acetyltransferase